MQKGSIRPRQSSELRLDWKSEKTLLAEQESLTMSIRIEKWQHPCALFCLSLFGRGSLGSRAEAAEHAAITLAYLAAMPKETQLLLANSLERNNPDFSLLHGDTDVCRLLSTGWLLSVPCSTKGIICFRIKPSVWRRLKSLCPTFLNYHLLCDLESYRKRKNALYPWIW